MAMKIKKWHKNLCHKITLIFLPHSSLRPLQFHLYLPSLLSIILILFVVLGWSLYVNSSYLCYRYLSHCNEQLKTKAVYIKDEVKRINSLVQKVSTLERSLISMLEMGDRHAIITSSEKGRGGLNSDDNIGLSRVIRSDIEELREEDIYSSFIELRDKVKSQIDKYEKISDYIKKQKDIYEATPNGYPTNGSISSPFGYRNDPFSGEHEFHTGVDIANQAGTPAYATANGVVALEGHHAKLGNFIVLEHGYAFTTVYGHNKKNLVKCGDYIRRGQIIAYMGQTGSTTGPHVHYEVWKNKRPVNPATFLAKKGG